MVIPKVSVQGVKSLWGDCSVFPILGTGGTKPSFMCHLSPGPNLPPWTLTLASQKLYVWLKRSDFGYFSMWSDVIWALEYLLEQLVVFHLLVSFETEKYT